MTNITISMIFKFFEQYITKCLTCTIWLRTLQRYRSIQYLTSIQSRSGQLQTIKNELRPIRDRSKLVPLERWSRIVSRFTTKIISYESLASFAAYKQQLTRLFHSHVCAGVTTRRSPSQEPASNRFQIRSNLARVNGPYHRIGINFGLGLLFISSL